MGYGMEQMEAHFVVTDAKKALEAIHKIPKGDYGWTDHEAALKADNLQDALEHWRWNWNESYAELNFNGEKHSGDEIILFNAIAPFVEKGGYIQMHGEDGAIWRWYFNGKTCEEQTGIVTFT
jgi:hypothetical protein